MTRTLSVTTQKPVKWKDILAKVHKIQDNFNPEKIILFGSYASGQPTADSDVDLLVIIDSDKPVWQLAVDISLLVEHSFPMDIIVKTPDQINERLNAGDFFIKDIIKNGKVLYEPAG